MSATKTNPETPEVTVTPPSEEALAKMAAETQAQMEAMLKKAQEESQALIAQAQQQAESLLTQAKEAAENQPIPEYKGALPPEVQALNEKGEELVEIRLFKGEGKYADDVFVAVNGESCLIRRGETVQIKRKFAEALENGRNQDERTVDIIKGFENQLKEAGDRLI